MEVKKTERANLEKHKVTYFLMGAVVGLSLLFVAFELGNRDIQVEEVEQTYVIEEVEDIQITPPDETPPPPPEPEHVEEVVVEVLQIVEDDVEVADVTIANVDDAADKVARDFAPPAPSQVGRREEVADDHIFEFLEEAPEFPGGDAALFKWLGDNINYPPIAAENNIQGRVLVSFVIERDGSVSDVRVVRGVDPNLDKEAVRVVKLMPKWKPGMQTGKPVRYRYNLPVAFRLR